MFTLRSRERNRERARQGKREQLSGECLFFTCLRWDNIYLAVLWFRIVCGSSSPVTSNRDDKRDTDAMDFKLNKYFTCLSCYVCFEH